MQLTEPLSRFSDQLAAKILAAALCMRCPSAQILEAREESYGFCVECYSSEVCSEALFPFLEEGMHELLSQKEIQTFEMVSSNAVDFLRFHHQKRRAQALKQWSYGLVHTIKIGNYVDFLESELDVHKALEELKTFKLIQLSSLVEKGPSGEERIRYRIKGVSSSQTRLLKEMVKQIKEANKSSHRQANHLLVEIGEDVLWLPQGLAHKRQLTQLISHSLKKEGYQEIESSKALIETAYTQQELRSLSAWFAFYQDSTDSSKEPELGLYHLKETLSVCGVRYCSKEKLLETYQEVLNLLLKIAQRFEWSYQIERKQKEQWVKLDQVPTSLGEEVRFFVKDSFERAWEIARIEIGEKKNPCYVKLLLISIERWFALLFDRSKGAIFSSFRAEIFECKE